jgi:hypothetical protein
VPVCPQCKEEGEEHHKHDVATISKSAGDVREALAQRVKSLTAFLDSLKAATREAKTNIERECLSSAAIPSIANVFVSDLQRLRRMRWWR